jgi:hypothetical protein
VFYERADSHTNNARKKMRKNIFLNKKSILKHTQRVFTNKNQSPFETQEEFTKQGATGSHTASIKSEQQYSDWGNNHCSLARQV